MDYKEHYKVDAQEFDYWGPDQISATEKRRNQTVFELSDIKPDNKVLDIGSGRGWFSVYASEMGAKVTALDLSEENLQKIKASHPDINAVYGDAQDIPSLDMQFDFVAALEVLEHLVDPKKAVAGWKNLLKAEGKLLVTVPFKETLRYTLCIHCNQKTPVNAHLHSFDKDSLIKLLNQNGFWVKETILFSHKALSHLKINSLTGRLPYKFWKFLDKLCGFFSRKYAYIALIAVRKD